MDNIQLGQTLGPYRIIHQIGQGGMATVYKAYHAAMDRYVAIKVLPRQLAESPEFIGRFQQEARTIAKLEHPHILPVHDYGESDGVTYLVMRYLDAGTLKDRIQAGALSLAEVDRLFSQLADALEYAHVHGIIHRDLKPSNVLVDARGNLFLTDFGIAKLLEGSPQFTSTGALIGTPAYMSPEQAQGQKVDQRSDIYSLGIILYEMVTGRVPFEADTPLAVVLKHLNEPLPLPSTVKPDISPSVERVLLKALAKNPDDRFASVSEFLAAWKSALPEAKTVRASAAAAEPVGAATLPSVSPGAPTVTAPTPGPAPQVAPQKLPLAWILGALGALVLVIVVAFVAIRFARNRANALRPTAAPTQAATTAPQPTSASRPTTGPAPTAAVEGEAGWTSWTAANTVFTVAEYGDAIYTGGPGGVTVWNRADGTVVRRFTTGDGLPSPQVNTLLVDEENGTLWVGTGSGLAEFDGETWTIYNTADGLDSDTITALVWVKDGLLVGTQYSGRDGGGLNLLTDTGWRPMPDFPSTNADEQADKLANAVNALLEDGNGVLWVATLSGLGRFDGKTWTRFTTADGLPDNNITTLMLDGADTLWAGTAAGPAKFDGHKFESTPQGPPYGVYGMVQDDEGRYWFSGGGGIWRFDPAKVNWDEYSQQTGDLPTYTMYRALLSSDGQLFFGSDGGGLVRYDGRKFLRWVVPNVPTQSAFGHILPAPDGQLWFVEEYGANVDRLDPQALTWSPLPELPCSCYPLAFDGDGNLWAAEYDNGLWIIPADGGDPTHLAAEDGLPSNQVNTVAFGLDRHVAWIGTDAGVALFDGEKVVDVLTAKSVGLASDAIRMVFAASDGSMWVSTDTNLSRLGPGGAWQHFTAGNPFDYDVRVNDIAEDASGAIWVATAGLGVYRYAEEAWKQMTPDTPGVKLPSTEVSSITVAPDGSIWFGTYYGGAARFDGTDWTTFDVEAGLIQSNVNDIYMDRDGVVWFATSGGATRYVP